VSNWNAARLERAIERDTLIRFYADIEESIAGQVRDIRFLEQQPADQRLILASLSGCSAGPDASASLGSAIEYGGNCTCRPTRVTF
jgi:hypothetical protein